MEFPIPPQQLPRVPGEHEIATTAQRHATQYAELLDHIINTVCPSNAAFENTVLSVASLYNVQAGERAVIKALKYCSPALSVQKESEKAEALWRESVHYKHARLYPLIISARITVSGNEREKVRLTEKMLFDLEELGSNDATGDSAQKIRENKESIKQHTVAFLCNLREEERSIDTTANDLNGVLDQLQNITLIEGQGLPQTIRVPYAGNYTTIMRLAHSTDVRKRMYEIHSTRYVKNVALFKEILLLRDENARLLGYENHAELRLRDRLPLSLAAVNKFLNSTLDTLHQHRDAAKIKTLKVAEFSRTEKKMPTMVEPWDKAYTKAKTMQTEASTTNTTQASNFAEYFPLWHTFQKILALLQDTLELKFHPIAASMLLDKNWHQEIKGWTLWEREPLGTGGFVGYLMVDLQNRPHKYKGSQSVNIQPGYIGADGARRYPANLLMCCFDASTSKRDYLLNHGDIRTLFHELGHSLHDLLARTTFARLHGYNVKRELGEAIAFTFEHWAWDEKCLKSMSCHYSFLTHNHEAERRFLDRQKVEIPDDILKRQLERQASTKRYDTTGELIHSIFDMAVHTPLTHQALLDLNEAAVWRDVSCRVTSMTAPSISDTSHVEFGHLVSGYDAGYYAYLYAGVVAANLTTSVLGTGLQSKMSWKRFRREILEKGGSEDEYALLESFLGHAPGDTASFFNMLGSKA